MDEPKIGERYKHFKGDVVEIICIARDCESPERKYVVYRHPEETKNFPKGTIWIRELNDFMGFKELNGEKIKRFTKIK